MPAPRKPKLKQADLAAHLDMSARNLRELIDKGVFTSPRDSLDIDQCRIDYIRHLRERASGREKPEPSGDASLDPDVKLALLREEYIQLAKLKRAKAEGELISRAENIVAVSAAFSRVKGVLLKIPRKNARQLAAMDDEAEVREFLDDVIKEGLDELASTPVESIGREAGADEIDLGTDDYEPE